MNSIPSSQILKLYKDLLRYGQQLKYTDKDYFIRRIKKEFRENRKLDDKADISFNFERSDGTPTSYSGVREMIFRTILFMNLNRTSLVSIVRKKVKIVDYSKVPILKDEDIEEKFVRGAGPGGQKINKTSSAVFLKHMPTGIYVKCQQSRSLDQNRKTARSLLITKLDNTLNGENSVENQKKAIENKKSIERDRRRNKLKEIKEEWLKREKGDTLANEKNATNK